MFCLDWNIFGCFKFGRNMLRELLVDCFSLDFNMKYREVFMGD